MATVTKKDLVDRIARDTGLKRVTVKRTVQQFLDEVVAELEQGNRLEFRDFGVFEVRERAARRAQNPKTLERLYVPPKRTVRFKAGRLMREAVEQQSAQANIEVKPVESPVAPQHNGHAPHLSVGASTR